jgi:hypothetical protein
MKVSVRERGRIPRLLHRAGGVKVTVMDDRMQRAPAFGFDSAREARAFGDWVTANFDAIRREAQTTTRTGHLQDIEQFSASRYLFLRFCSWRLARTSPTWLSRPQRWCTPSCSPAAAITTRSRSRP